MKYIIKGIEIMNTSNRITPIQPPDNGVNVGDEIEFSRQDKDIKGTVIHIRELSVIVQLEPKDIQFLRLDNEFTVVNHKKYTIVKKNESV